MNSVVSVKIPKGWTGEPPVSGTDIAILKLNTKVNFILNNEKNAIMPACLPNRRVHNNVYNQEAYTAGIRYGTFLQQPKCGYRFPGLQAFVA